MTSNVIISKAGGYLAAAVLAFLMFASVTLSAWDQGATGVNIVIQLRLAGDSRALPQLGSCLNSKLLKMPDIEVVAAPSDRVRFIVDIIAGKGADDGMSVSLVVAETFPIEEFRLRVKAGEDADALLATIRYYTLLRLHELVPGRTAQSVCTKIAVEISGKLLSGEYIERDD
jgi:hypothetical protein